MANDNNDSSPFLTSSTSSSSENEPAIKRRKRYKQFLYKEFTPHSVSVQTQRKYDRWTSSFSNNTTCLYDKEDTELPYSSPIHDNRIDDIIHDDKHQINYFDELCDNNVIYFKHTSDVSQEENKEEKEKLEKTKNITDADDIIENDSFHESQEDDEEEKEKLEKTDDFTDAGDISDNDSFHESNYFTSSIDSECNSDIETDNDFSNYFERIMFPASKLSVRCIILICSAFALRFKLSDEAVSELVKILISCAGPEFVNLNLSKYIMSQCFSSQNEHVFYYYYCMFCTNNIIHSANGTERLSKKVIFCKKCKNRNVISSLSRNYFISLDIYYQLQILFSNDNIFQNLLCNVQSENNRSLKGSIIFKNILNNNKSTTKTSDKQELLVTFNCNTDGAPLTKSGKRSFWPLQISINELSFELRNSFVLLAGLLMIEHEPNSTLMNMYLSKFVEQIKNLYKNGLQLVHNGKNYVVKFCVLSWPVDTVCRPIVQNRLKFNGYSSCSWCYQLAKYIKTVRGIRYIRDQESILRSHESHLNDIAAVIETGRNCRGVKGSSILLQLPNCDIVWSFPFEYMHGLLLGVTMQLINLWKKSDCKFKISNRNIGLIDNEYTKITPIHEIHRLPRSGIIKGTAKPKASEMKSWLLFYSLPLLKNILDSEALKHYQLLVKSAFTLLKNDISEFELNQCEKDLIKFVCQFQDLYGLEAMTFNVHSLMHCVQSVRQTGPLHLNSAFTFESSIYTLKQYINGPKGMDKQIARKHLQKLIFKCNAKDFVEEASEEIMTFCFNIFAQKKLTLRYKQIENITFCGKGVLKNYQEIGECISYKKCIYKGTVFHSVSYVKNKKNDDSVLQLQSGEYCRILEILHCNNNNTCVLRVALIVTSINDPFSGVCHIKKVEKQDKNVCYINIDLVKEKVIFFNVFHECYLCIMPNFSEVQ